MYIPVKILLNDSLLQTPNPFRVSGVNILGFKLLYIPLKAMTAWNHIA